MDYSVLKHAHAGLAYLTVLFFVVRFALFALSPKLRSYKVFKVLPHIIDTLLLIFALIMVFSVQFTLDHAWLTAKVLGLAAYIVFGVFAIRKGKLWALVGALASYGYVLGVAKYKTVLSWWVLF